MTRRKVSNPLALAVLTLLSERPMHPYEMSSTLRERHKHESIKLNYGSLYSVVEALQRHALIAVQEVVREGRRPERTVYQLTETGHQELVDWLSELLAIPVKEFTAFEAALSLLGALPPDDALRQLELRLGDLTLQQRSQEAIAASVPGLPRIFRLEFEYTSALLTTELAFVRGLVADIRSGELEGLAAWRRYHELRDTDLTPAQLDEALAHEFPEHLEWLADFQESTRTPRTAGPTPPDGPAEPVRTPPDTFDTAQEVAPPA